MTPQASRSEPSSVEPRRVEPLWLALRLPDLAANALGIHPRKTVEEEQALVVEHKQKVFYASAAAHKKGVRTGMDITTACVLSHCERLLREPDSEQQLLQQLAEQLYQFSPYIESRWSDEGGGLLLEISRCLKLFRGVVPLCQQVQQCLLNNHINLQSALAHSAPAAWLLSHGHYPIDGHESRALFIERLNQIPVRALPFPKAVSTLEKSGFVSLGDVHKQISAQNTRSIRKRLGEEFNQYLCEVFGIEQNFDQRNLFEKPRPTFTPSETYNDSIQFDSPLSEIEHIKPTMHIMLENFANYLQQRQLETQEIQWTLADIYGAKDELLIHCDNPQSRCDLFYELTGVRLEHQNLSFAVDTLGLHCTSMQVVHNRDQNLPFQNNKPFAQEHNFAVTLAKLKITAGDDAVFKLSYHDSHIPEQSQQTIPIANKALQALPPLQDVALRPNWIFPQPQKIQLRAQQLYWYGYLQILSTPERIETHWWDKPTARDYFMALREDYLRLWIFWDLYKGHWYVHGVFS